MRGSLNVIQAALDAAAAPVHFFLRDDDAGWDDDRLFKLLDCTQRAGVPIDLAVIPQACSDALGRALCTRMDASPGQISVHQHGFAHVNHETVGRKSEFGEGRSLADQRNDLIKGRERLRDLFGDRLEPSFTPPWNRCSAGTPAVLAELGYTALSRDVTAPAQCALPELSVDIDWCKERRTALQQGTDAAERIEHKLTHCIADGQCVGLMLHHAAMDTHDLELLEALLSTSRHSLKAQWVSMSAIHRMRNSEAAPIAPLLHAAIP